MWREEGVVAPQSRVFNGRSLGEGREAGHRVGKRTPSTAKTEDRRLRSLERLGSSIGVHGVKRLKKRTV